MDSAILVIVLPLITSFILGIISVFTKKGIKIIVLLSSLSHLLLILNVVSRAHRQPLVYSLGNWDFWGINLLYDNFSIIILLLIGFFHLTAVIYSHKYIKKDYTKYYMLLLIMMAGITGMIATADLFNLYVFFEITSITSYALVAIHKSDISIEASFKYLVLGTAGGLFVLLAIILIYYSTGTLNMAQVASSFPEIPVFLTGAIITFLTFGFAVKMALIPLHTWLPDSYLAAPVPYNVLSSALILKSALFVLLRLMYSVVGIEQLQNFNFTSLYVYWGVITLLIAHTLAYQQTNIKRLLAYSSIAHMGYIIMAVGLGTAEGLIAGGFHAVNHAIMKATLFFATGIFIYTTDNVEIEKIRGIAGDLPLISFIFTIAALAIIGLPPFNGFLSKWLIIEAALKAGYTYAAFFIPVGSLISLAYYLKIIKAIYADSKKNKVIKLLPPRWSLSAPTVFLGSLCFIFGIFPSLPLKLINNIHLFLLNNTTYIRVLLGG